MTGNRVLRSVLTLLMLAAMLTISAPLKMVAGANGVTVSVNAPDYVTPDSSFTATINITEVANFDVANYDVSFNPLIVELTGVSGGKIGGIDIPVVWNQAEPGRITVVQNIPGVPGVNGTGYLAGISFHVLGAPGQNSTITLDNSILGDNTGQAIPATWAGDLVRISAHETATVSINAPAVVNKNSNFGATIDISQVTSFDAASYNVLFDPTVLQITGVSNGSIGGTAIPVVWNQPEPGRIAVAQNLPGVQGASGSGYLATLGFRVVGDEGQSSNITLSSGMLSDGAAQIIPAVWLGGTIQVFGILITPPAVTTDTATNITTNSARLNGILTSLGTALSANASFQWGTASGNYTFETPAVSMNATGPFSYILTGLSDNTTYYFRARALGDGTSYGTEKSFATALLLPGDANGDGAINVLDLTKVARIILLLDAETPGADANLDGVVNVLDMSKLVRLILRLD